MDKRSGGGFYSYCNSVGDGVVNSYKLRAHRAELNGIPRSDSIHFYLAQIMLLKLAFNKPERQAGTVYRNIRLFKKIGYAADMILVPVGQKHSPYLIRILFNISKIRDYNVHTRHFSIREGHSAVDYYYIIPILNKGHILADFVKTSKWDYSHRGVLALVRPFTRILLRLLYDFGNDAFRSVTLLRIAFLL